MDKPVAADNKPAKVKLEKGIQYKWCVCGHSKIQPFCDHSHRKASPNLKSLRFIVENTDDYFLCKCKQTKTPPFCDGSHKSISNK
jgi:CDGSH-type Zn-finger protein